MSKTLRIMVILVAAMILVVNLPLCAFAVDPVSAATMANAFAQAITAYGASQGVSMTFDVTNTDGIGEGVHDLWEQYASDMAQSNVTVSDYSNLAASVFPTLWTKTFGYVTANLDAAVMGEVDGFWNWLLSGPAEMTKVDNQYYEWTVDSQTGNVLPVLVNSISFSSLNGKAIAPYGSNYTYDFYYNNDFRFSTVITNNSSSSSAGGLFFIRNSSDPTQYSIYKIFESSSYQPYSTSEVRSNGDSTSYNYNTSYYIGSLTYSGGGFITVNNNTYGGSIRNFDPGSIPVYVGDLSDLTSVFGTIDSNTTISSSSDNISVKPYIGDSAPQDVYIPDNKDVNYSPEAVSIPLDIPWNDELYGDGTGTLTDAQSEAITRAADDAITDNPDKTLELADTAPAPPVPDPSEVYIPFLPVTLPSFQFSLSGIWHYVTAWVASLGAWLSLVFTTWSYLPYAISVPVYATAVIVIVLGVYKRFFM